jgi:hypothetical protein
MMETVYLCWQREADEYGQEQIDLVMAASSATHAQAWIRGHIPGAAAWTITERIHDPRPRLDGDAMTFSTVSLHPMDRQPYTLWEAKCFGKVKKSSRKSEAHVREWLDHLLDPDNEIDRWDRCWIQAVDLDVLMID